MPYSQYNDDDDERSKVSDVNDSLITHMEFLSCSRLF